MNERSEFCKFYSSQTGKVAVWIRDEKRFSLPSTELAWQAWQAAQKALLSAGKGGEVCQS